MLYILNTTMQSHDQLIEKNIKQCINSKIGRIVEHMLSNKINTDLLKYFVDDLVKYLDYMHFEYNINIRNTTAINYSTIIKMMDTIYYECYYEYDYSQKAHILYYNILGLINICCDNIMSKL